MANFIRWNSSTHIYELSTNDGVSFSPLPLNASVINEGTLAAARLPAIPAGNLPANVAYKDIDNAFVPQTLATGSQISGSYSTLYFKDSIGGLNSKIWRAVQYGDGVLRFESVPDDLSAVQGWIYITRAGSLTAAGSLTTGGSIVSGQNFYEKGRSIPLGHANPGATSGWSTYPAGTWTVPAGSINKNHFIWIGNTAIYSLVLGPTTVTGSVSHLAVPNPAIATYGAGSGYMEGGGVRNPAYIYSSPGDPYMYILRGDATGIWPASISAIWVSIVLIPV